MNPTNLLLIVALGSPNCATRHEAQTALECQGLAAMPTLLTFEKDSDPEVAKSCTTIKNRITSKYITAWANDQQFRAWGYNTLSDWKLCPSHQFWAYYDRAGQEANLDFQRSCYAQYRYATRLLVIDLLLSGASWEDVAPYLGDDGMNDTNYPENGST